tara:strand:- start:1621 stop:2691 length:1071 start_codon:yes stop_codon:yes gene_type:complete
MSYIGQGLPDNQFIGYDTETFTGDGTANKAFTLSKKPFSENSLLVTIDGVVQEATEDFTVSGTTLTLVGTAPNNSEVNVVHLGAAAAIGEASKLDLNGASDQLILDADADTTISADTDDQIDFKVGGTDILNITNSSSNAVISSMSNDKDIIFKGQDGGSTITAFTLDMSAGGEAELRNGLTLADGDLTVASGHGINFAATSDASAMSSELLDDYEEGTFTVALDVAGAALSTDINEGRYVKIGTLVHIQAWVRITNLNSQTGSVGMSGLPYTATNANSGYASANTGYSTGLALPVHDSGDNASYSASFSVSVDKNATTMFIRRQGDSGDGQGQQISATQLSADGQFMFQFSYTTN